MGNEDQLGIATIPIRATLDKLDDDMAQAKGKIGKGLDGINDMFSKIGVGTIGAGVAIAGFTKFMGDAVSMAQEAEQIQADLNATLESTKGAAGLTGDEINNMAGALSNLTQFEDDSIVQGQAMLLTFTNIGKDVFPQTTEAMLNMTEKFGNMNNAAIQLGKALNDPITGVTALRRVGVALTEQQEEQIKKFVEQGDIASAQKIILAELETEFGGLARAMGETTEGQMTIFNNKLGNLQEAIGTGVLPVMGELMDKVTDIAAPFMEMDGLLTSVTENSVGFAASPLFAALDNAATASKAVNEVLEISNDLLEMLGLNAENAEGEMTIFGAVVHAVSEAVRILAGGPLVLLNEGFKAIADIIERIKALDPQQIWSDLSGVGSWAGGLLNFDSGGTVPGPIGAPRLAVVHGGEEVIPVGGSSWQTETNNNFYLTVQSRTERSVIQEFNIMRSLAGA